ncbi:MAG: type IV toxin-antitoxin system AbiEi family antitoxin domain-containing protein [Ornithinibacter sp.]
MTTTPATTPTLSTLTTAGHSAEPVPAGVPDLAPTPAAALGPPATADAESLASLDAALVTTARSQQGMFTTAQALRAGLSPAMLVALVKAGVLRHPGRGLYAVEALADPDPESWHRQLCAGAFLLYPDAVLAGTSALLAHGITVWGVSLSSPSILRPVKRAGGMSAFWVRPARGEAVTTGWGPASRPATALVQHAVDHGIVTGVVSADAALRQGTVTLDALATEHAAVATWPHSSRAASMLRLVDGRRESVGESRCGVALAMAGIDVTPQVPIVDERGSFVARVDFLVDGTRVVIEFDGKVKYAAGDPKVLWDEKRREDRLRRLGYVVVRITWAQLEQPGAVVAAVRAALRTR